MKRNKKGFLLAEQTVKIIIALIALGFLIYLLTSLYFSKVRSENQIKAEAILSTGGDTLEKTIKNLSEGETKVFALYNPTGWYLFSFTGEHTKPTKCEKQNCLCICENVIDIMGKQIKYCQNYGACIQVLELRDYEDELEVHISPSTALNLNKNNGIVSVT